jgi:protein tyrosine/serine phosphatase
VSSRDASNGRRRGWRAWLKRSALGVLVLVLTCGAYGAYVRYVRLNFHTIVAGQVYRSSQPTQKALQKWTRQYGLKTVINLRGSDETKSPGDGLSVVDIHFSAQQAPRRQTLLRFIDALETVERPVLIHCRDGIDRTGVASVLAKMALGGASFEEARSQLSLQYLYVERGGRHIADLLEEYEEYCSRKQKDTAGWDQFRWWATTHYRPYYYYLELSSPKEIRAVVGTVVRTTVRITNRSEYVLPAGESDRRYRLGCFRGPRETEWPDATQRCGPHVDLPKRNLHSGDSVEITHSFNAPSTPGREIYYWDVIEVADKPTWFGRQGSPVTEFALVTVPDPSG